MQKTSGFRGPDPERRGPKYPIRTFHILLAVLAGVFANGAIAAMRQGWALMAAVFTFGWMLLLWGSLRANRKALEDAYATEPAAAGM